MVEKIIYFIFFIFSVICYLTAPEVYSENYCKMQLTVFVIVMIYAINTNYKRYESYFNFNTIFLIIFGLTTYLHSAFYVPIESFFSAYRYSYNSQIVNESICVAQIGISSYLIGTTFYKPRTGLSEVKITPSFDYIRFYQKLSFSIALLWFIYVFFILKRDLAYVIIYPKLTLLLTSIIVFNMIISTLYFKQNSANASFRTYILANKLNWLTIAIFLFPFFYLGSRTNPSALVIIILALINKYVYKFRLSFLLPFILLGIGLMGIISMSRISEVNFLNANILDAAATAWASIFENKNILTFFLQDFIVNSRNLYDGVDYPNHNTMLFGLEYFVSLFSFIPFLPTVLLSIIGLSPVDINSSHIMSRTNNSSFGLGTHIIGDIYMNGGIIAVILIMLFIGYVVTKSEYHKTSIFLLLSCSFYGVVLMFARISPFSWIDMFYMLLIQYLIFKHKYRIAK